MRHIGTLPTTLDSDLLGDYLLSLGVKTRTIEGKDGWAIWVLDEDKVALAREEFAAYQANPDDPRYIEAAAIAGSHRQEMQRLERDYNRRVRDMKGTWDVANTAGRQPLTFLLVAVSVVIFVVGTTTDGFTLRAFDALAFFDLETAHGPADVAHGLRPILGGQIWRLVTPIFLHLSWFHLGFNVWAMWVVGGLVERRRGTWTLALLVLLSAVASNVGQYIYTIVFHQELALWGGISGVVYALFGYVWMKGRVEPEQGMILHESSVRIMLLWLLLGFTGFLKMANGAHLVGLIVGMLFGLARF